MTKDFLFCGTHGIVEETIVEVLHKHREVAQVIDLENDLKHMNDDQLMGKLQLLTLSDDELYLLPTCPTNRFEKLTDRMYRLSIVSAFGEMSILLQVCALVGHRPTRYEMLIAAFETGGIRELDEMGASRQEVQYIMLRNRLANGSMVAEEEVATMRPTLLEKAPDLADSYGNFYVLNATFRSNQTIVETLLYKHYFRDSNKGLGVLFIEEEASGVVKKAHFETTLKTFDLTIGTATLAAKGYNSRICASETPSMSRVEIELKDDAGMSSREMLAAFASPFV